MKAHVSMPTRGEGGAIVGEAAVPAAMANRWGAGVADWPSPARGGKMGTAREAIGDSMRNPETGKLTPAASRIGKAAGVAVGGTVGHAIPIPGAGYGGGVIGYELGPTIMERMFPESAERTSIRQVGQDELLRQKSLKNPAVISKAARWT